MRLPCRKGGIAYMEGGICARKRLRSLFEDLQRDLAVPRAWASNRELTGYNDFMNEQVTRDTTWAACTLGRFLAKRPFFLSTGRDLPNRPLR